MAVKAITPRRALCTSASAAAVGVVVPGLGAALFGALPVLAVISAAWLAVAVGWGIVAALSSPPKS